MKDAVRPAEAVRAIASGMKVFIHSAAALISIAHPDFREELRAKAAARRLVGRP